MQTFLEQGIRNIAFKISNSSLTPLFNFFNLFYYSKHSVNNVNPSQSQKSVLGGLLG